MKLLLTDRFCDRAKPQGPQTDYFDETVSGLALRVSVDRKTWTLHFSSPINGKRARMTLGTYPAASLAAARTKALEAKALVEEGRDPRGAAKDTFQAIAEEYMRRDGKKLRNRDWEESALRRLVYPALGHKLIAEIKRTELVRLLDKIEDENGPVQADRTLAVIRKIMNWYASRSDDFRSPIVRGMARTKSKERARDRILTDEEIRAIWATKDGVFVAFVRFLLLTAARRNEASDLAWAEIEGGDWTLPAARNKTKVDLIRPLSRAAMEVIEALPRQGPFVFTTNGTKPIAAFSGFKRKLDRELGIEGWTLHDCRRTARSLMSRAGVASDHAERCLGHVIGGIRGVYDRHEYHREKAHAFEALAALIERIVHPPADNVTQLARRARGHS
jgi:integrase